MPIPYSVKFNIHTSNLFFSNRKSFGYNSIIYSLGNSYKNHQLYESFLFQTMLALSFHAGRIILVKQAFYIHRKEIFSTNAAV